MMRSCVIYGYLWDEKREHWLVDKEAAEVVRRIFSLAMEGYGPYQISKLLSEAKVEIPAIHLARFHEGVNRTKPVKDPYGWGSSTIVNILKKREYLGHTISFKTRKHFKDKKSHYVDESEWTIFENTHEAIIDQQTFDLVQKSVGMSDATRTAGAKQLPSQACFIVPIAAARCMSTAPTTASAFHNSLPRHLL